MGESKQSFPRAEQALRQRCLLRVLFGRALLALAGTSQVHLLLPVCLLLHQLKLSLLLVILVGVAPATAWLELEDVP